MVVHRKEEYWKNCTRGIALHGPNDTTGIWKVDGKNFLQTVYYKWLQILTQLKKMTWQNFIYFTWQENAHFV